MMQVQISENIQIGLGIQVHDMFSGFMAKDWSFLNCSTEAYLDKTQ
jgi:hypothetical protein